MCCLGQRQKLNVILFFDIECFKYFFRVLHEANSSWLKFCRSILGLKTNMEKKSKSELFFRIKKFQRFFGFIDSTILTADKNFKFKHRDFCNLLLIIIGIIWSSTFKLKVTKVFCQLKQ
jgi:hypothetical protein